jgi:hypothetical protein
MARSADVVAAIAATIADASTTAMVLAVSMGSVVVVARADVIDFG